MNDLHLPSEGLTILHNQPVSKGRTNKELPQIIQLNLVESVTKEILKSIRNHETARIKLGKKPTVHYGKRQLTLYHASDAFPCEIFTGPLDGSKPVYFSGKLSHTLEIQKAKQDTAGSDEKLAALENTLKSLKEERASTLMKNNGDLRKKDNKLASMNSRDRLLGTTSPSSPYLGAGLSPRLGPASNPLLSTAVPTKEKIRQDAMRIPLVHLLAVRPMKPRAIAEKLNVTVPECEKVLDKVARDGSGGEKELKDKCFKELDVWKFPYQNDDQQAAIARAIHAYDRMRIEKSDQLWQMLLPKEERDKGKTLSRLNFDRLTLTNTTPKVALDGETKAEASDKEGKAKNTKAIGNPKEVVTKKKPTGDLTTKKKVERAPPKNTSQSTKQDTKFKSSERIEDSDEEAEGVEVVPAKPETARTKDRGLKVKQPTKAAPSPQASSQQHKSKLSNSSVSSNDTDKRRAQTDQSRLKPQPKTERPAANTSRISPRPRTGSSPQKPSPLGSSPPTNSIDLENSSKSSTQSSAPSSPPSSTDMPPSQARKNYSPVITGKGRDTSNPVKRKAERSDDPPAKRQQVHGLGLPKSLTDQLQQPTPERRSSASSSSSPERSVPTKQSVIAAGKHFKVYYSRYKDLHVKLSSLPPDDRSNSELETLWKMHERLEGIKSDLWADWAKAGGGA